MRACRADCVPIPTDACTAEEVKDASATLPKALLWSFGFNAVLGFIMAVTIVFTLGDVEEILASATGKIRRTPCAPIRKPRLTTRT